MGAGPGHLPAEGAAERSPAGGPWSICRSRDPVGPGEGERAGGEALEQVLPAGPCRLSQRFGFYPYLKNQGNSGFEAGE